MQDGPPRRVTVHADGYWTVPGTLQPGNFPATAYVIEGLQGACDTCLGARVMCYRDMKAEPCRAKNESACPNTGHHACPACR